MRFRCDVHNVTVTVKDSTRKFRTPQGSWGGVEQCNLMLLKDIREGTYGRCVVKRIDEEPAHS